MRLAAFFCDWRIEAQRVLSGCVPLPAQSDDGVAVAQQPGVSGITRQIPISTVDDRKNAAAPAVRHFQQQGAVAFFGVLRADGDEVRGKLDLAVLQVHRVVEIDDSPVMWISHRHGEVHAPGDAFVGAGVAEGLAAENVVTRSDLDANDLGVEQRNTCNQTQQQGAHGSEYAHARKHSIAIPPNSSARRFAQNPAR